MAGITKKADAFYCTFRFQGRRYYFTVGKLSEARRGPKPPTIRSATSGEA